MEALPKLPVGESWQVLFGEVDGYPKVFLSLLRDGVDVRHGTIDVKFYGYIGAVQLAHNILDEQKWKK